MNRRTFLIGTSIAIAAAALPFATALATPKPIFNVRRYSGLSLIAAERLKASLFRGSAEFPIMSWEIGSLGHLIWNPGPRGDIVILPSGLLRLESSGGIGSLNLFFSDDDGPTLCEHWLLPVRGPAEIISLEMKAVK